MGMNIGSLLTLTLGVGESWAQAEIYKKISGIKSQSFYFVKQRICISCAINGISLSESVATYKLLRLLELHSMKNSYIIDHCITNKSNIVVGCHKLEILV